MSSVSTISHEERLLPQCFSVNDLIIERVYTFPSELKELSINLECLLLKRHKYNTHTSTYHLVLRMIVLFELTVCRHQCFCTQLHQDQRSAAEVEMKEVAIQEIRCEL